MIKKVTPFLMYNHNLEEVLDFYASVFKDFKIIQASKNEDGKTHMVTIQIHGQNISAYNGGPYFKFTEGFSLMIECETQADIDYLWEKLSKGGRKSQCGWVEDKFGLSWQVIPGILMKMIGDKNREKANQATQAMLKMRKIEIAVLEKAFNQS